MDDEIEESNDIQNDMQNRKQRKAGGFQSMGLDFNVLKGVLKRGYKVPTPIQRKTIPFILNNKDVVAMARTGSGKTAAFLVPLLQRLKCRSPKAGARAILISPTRELALQTLKFTKDLGKFVGLKAVTLIGGDNMEEQFAAIHENPDIIIATPGRLLHVAVEMNLKLKSVEYVVFDEADRLFEMGFEEQLKDVIRRLPENRQTLLFSATLPKNLIDFVKVGLNEPVLVRLDVDNKISDKLNVNYLVCRFEEKLSVLFYLLHHVIDVTTEQTIIFCATKHHVEYLKEVLWKASFKCSFVYSSLDATARKLNIEKFRKKQTSLLLVTDLAARGIDIPLLDNVINFHFPSKSKLFVHRVGRVARAGRSGRAFSIISSEEIPYVLDLYLFLGRTLTFLKQHSPENEKKEVSDIVGAVPQTAIDDEDEAIKQMHVGNNDLEFLRQGSINAYKKYVRTRPIPSRESVERTKKESFVENLSHHPIFIETNDTTLEAERLSLVDKLKNFKPQATVFELNTNSKQQGCLTMKAKRKAHEKFIVNKVKSAVEPESMFSNEPCPTISSSENEIQNVFHKIIESKFKRVNKEPDVKNEGKKTKMLNATKDSEYFVPYKPLDFHSEAGLLVEKSAFEREVTSAVVDFTADDVVDMRKRKNQMKWDRKRKKFVRENDEGRAKKIRTESGAWIPATYKSDLYSKWKHKTKIDHQNDDRSDEEEGIGGKQEKFGQQFKKTNRKNFGGRRGTNNNVGKSGVNNRRRGGNRREIKSKEQILKDRKQKGKIKSYQNYRREQNVKKKSFKKTKR